MKYEVCRWSEQNNNQENEHTITQEQNCVG